MDSTSIGGVPITPQTPYNTVMEPRPRRKALKEQQLKGDLRGALADYEKIGLFQRPISQSTAYRYRGALLRYQAFLGDNPPSLAATLEYLGSLRQSGFDPATLRIYRAALAGFHQWRGEELKFVVRVPETSARYIPWEIVQKMLQLASPKPHDELVLRLLSNGGLRLSEVVNLNVGNVEGSRMRFRGKGGKERTVPLTDELSKLVDRFSANKPKEASLIELGKKGVYLLVKRYGVRAGMPEIAPHDLRRAAATHLLNVTGNIRIVQEFLGHSNVNTTQAYTAVTFKDLEEAINKLNSPPASTKNVTDSHHDGEREETAVPQTYRETAHQTQMRELAKTMMDRIHFPSHSDKELLRDLPVEFLPGTYYLPIGTVQIKETGEISIKYHDMGTGIAAPHLVKGLFDHLATSGISKFAELAGDRGKFNQLKEKFEQNALAMVNLLKLITDEVKESKIKANFHDEIVPGLTRWFFLTSWHDAISNAGSNPWINDSWYKTPENITETNLLKLDCGGYTLGIAKSRKTIKTFEHWHKQLRNKYAKHQSAKEVHINNREIDTLAQQIRERLEEFSDMQYLPGMCDLCRPSRTDSGLSSFSNL